MLISVTEPPALRAIGQTSEYPEAHGCDIAFVALGKWIGIQRKEIMDLFQSVEGNRLQGQMDKMTNLDVAYLIVEGKPSFSNDGKLLGKRHGQPWTETRYLSVLISCQHRGLKVLHTDDLAHTIRMCLVLEAWHNKEDHSLLGPAARSGPTTLFGSTPTQREFGIHVLQSIPGVGVKMAGAIFDLYGLPVTWTVTEKDLMKVPGIGKAKAGKIVRAFADRKPTELVK